MKYLKMISEKISGKGSWDLEIESCITNWDYQKRISSKLLGITILFIVIVDFFFGAYLFFFDTGKFFFDTGKYDSIGDLLLDGDTDFLLMIFQWASQVWFLFNMFFLVAWSGYSLYDCFRCKIKEKFCRVLTLSDKKNLKM